MRFTLAALSLAGAASLANASSHQASSKAHALAARSVDVSVHKNDPRTLCLIEGILSGILGSNGACGPSKPSSSWICSGSGLDGYDWDYNGKSCPSSYPAGFKWFGSKVGWAPPVGWGVPSNNWVIPSIWLPRISLCTWWAPPPSWTCPPSVKPPQWWPQPPAPSTTSKPKPPATTTTSSSIAPPSPTVSCPPRNWQCNKSGHDGWDVDYDGKSCPYTGDQLMNSNGKWKFFGSSFGWQPEESWNIPYDTWSPPSGWGVQQAQLAVWWSPASSWQYPSWWSTSLVPCSFWPKLDPSWCSWLAPTPTTSTKEAQPTQAKPSQGWQCNKSGHDGWDVDYDGKSCPYTGDQLMNSNGKWKFFGSSFGWQPEESWNIPYDTWSPPSGWSVQQAQLAVWWSPASSWQYPSWWSTSLVPCSFWPKLDPNWCSWLSPTPAPSSSAAPPPATTSSPPPPATTSSTPPPPPPPSNNWPSQDWNCDGSGTDGKPTDWQGNTCPYAGLPFLWFGKNFGWQPAKGWWSVSVDFQFPTEFLNNCGKATWWAPSSSWKFPSWFTCPSFWPSLGWHSYQWPASSWTCNGSGQDGWDFDHLGNKCPGSLPSGWKYFGIGPQWQPALGWQIPSQTWTPPSSWSPNYATWWKPQSQWKLPQGYSCPSWWPTNLLSFLTGGIFDWLFGGW